MARLLALLALVCSAQAFTFAPAAGAVGRQSTVSMNTKFTDPYVQKMKKKNKATGSTKNLKGYTVGSRAPKVAKSSGTTTSGYKTNGGIGEIPRGQNVPTAAVLIFPVALYFATEFLGKTWFQ